MEYIRNSRDLCEKGLYVELDAYKCHVFLDWYEVEDNEWHQYAHLTDYLKGRGVPSIEEALREVFLQAIHYPFRELVNAASLRQLVDSRVTAVDADGQPAAEMLDAVEHKVARLLREIKQFAGGTGDEVATAQEIRHKLEASLQLPVLAASHYPALESTRQPSRSYRVVWATTRRPGGRC